MEYAPGPEKCVLTKNDFKKLHHPRRIIFSTHISTGSFREFIDYILKLPEIQVSSYVCFANVHMIIEGYKNREFCASVNRADIVAPDGKPLSVFLNVFYGSKQEKISGPDVFPDILNRAALEGKKVFFYGSTNTVLEKVVNRTQNEFPNLKVVGTYSPPFRDLTSEENKTIVDKINLAAPHFVFVALGCPKQEKWMAENKGKVFSCMLGVGQAFQVYANELKRAPKLLQDLGFEWAHRVYLEPGRLWKRYLQTNSLFLFLAIQYGIKNIFKVNPIKFNWRK